LTARTAGAVKAPRAAPDTEPMSRKIELRSLLDEMRGRYGHVVVFLEDGRGYCIHHECEFVASDRHDANEHEQAMKE
jgi:hypothetical protein